MAESRTKIKLADQVWVATATLHQEHPEREAFMVSEIVERVRHLFGLAAPGIPVHVSQQCVANKKPNPGRYRVLFATPEGRRRLFRPGDEYHPEREGAKYLPLVEDIPEEFESLLHWYEEEYASMPGVFGPDHPLLALSGAGASGHHDVSEEHDRHLAEIYLREHAEGPQQPS